MMHLPALDAEERAYLLSLLPDSALQAFARRLEQRLLVNLGALASISVLPVGDRKPADADEPSIRIAPELAAAWLNLRLGGRAGPAAKPMKDASLAAPLMALIRRVLAESAVNAGEVDWPQAMRLYISIDGQRGEVEISWDSAHARDWARRAIREKA